MCAGDDAEWRNVLLGQGEMMTNLDLSGSPASHQSHRSRNIGLHPLATTILLCFFFFTLPPPPLLIAGLWCISLPHFLSLPYLCAILSKPLPGQWFYLDLTPIYGKQAKVQNDILIVINWCELWLLRAFKVSVSAATSASFQRHSGHNICDFRVSDALLTMQANCSKLIWPKDHAFIYRFVCHSSIAFTRPTIVYDVTRLLITE